MIAKNDVQQVEAGQERRVAGLHVQRNGGSPQLLAEVSSSQSVAGSYLASLSAANFDDVRVHTGSASGQSSSAISTQAFTRGNEIHLRPSLQARFEAHELAHVVQQR